MTPNSSRRHATAVLLDEHDFRGLATCPLCHTSTTLTRSAFEAGGSERCVRCGQQWDEARLAAVDAYATWTAEHDRVDSRGPHDRHGTAPGPDSPTERPGGRP